MLRSWSRGVVAVSFSRPRRPYPSHPQGGAPSTPLGREVRRPGGVGLAGGCGRVVVARAVPRAPEKRSGGFAPLRFRTDWPGIPASRHPGGPSRTPRRTSASAPVHLARGPGTHGEAARLLRQTRRTITPSPPVHLAGTAGPPPRDPLLHLARPAGPPPPGPPTHPAQSRRPTPARPTRPSRQTGPPTTPRPARPPHRATPSPPRPRPTPARPPRVSVNRHGSGGDRVSRGGLRVGRAVGAARASCGSTPVRAPLLRLA